MATLQQDVRTRGIPTTLPRFHDPDDPETFAIEVLRTGELVIDGLTREDARAKARSMNTGATVEELVIWRIDRRRPVNITERTDEDLMADVRDEASPEAFAELHRRYRARIYRYAYGKTENHHVADDIAQESFVAIFQNRHRFRSDSRVKPWLFTIARIQSLLFFRRGRRSRVCLGDTQNARSKEPTGLQAMLETERAQVVNESVAQLSGPQVEIVRLRFFDDHKVADLAKSNGITSDGMTARFRVIRKQLHAKLSNFWIDDGAAAGKAVRA